MHQSYEVTRNFVYEEGLPGEEILVRIRLSRLDAMPRMTPASTNF